MLKRKRFLWIILCGGVLLAVAGCAAPMDASKAHSRAVIQQGGIIRAEELRVAEYLAKSLRPGSWRPHASGTPHCAPPGLSRHHRRPDPSTCS